MIKKWFEDKGDNYRYRKEKKEVVGSNPTKSVGEKQSFFKKINWQFLIGVSFLILGIWLSYDSITILEMDKYLAGIIMGQGVVFILWGIRELIGGLSK